MAVSKMQTDIAVGTITAESGVTFSELSVTQIGNIVCVRGYATLSTAASQGTEKKLGTLSGVPFPKSTLRSLCGTTSGASYDAYNVGYLVIGTVGNIGVKTNNSNQKTFTFCVSYSIL